MVWFLLLLIVIYVLAAATLGKKLVVSAIGDVVMWMFDIVPVYIVAHYLINLYVSEYKLFVNPASVFNAVVEDNGVRVHLPSVIFGALFALIISPIFGVTSWLYGKLASAVVEAQPEEEEKEETDNAPIPDGPAVWQ